jgi:hypothetical protein
MYLTFQDGLRRVFPPWSDLDPDDAIDVIYSSEEPSASFALARAGLVLPDPARYVPPAETPHRPSPFDREFAWGQLPRRILRAGVVLYGAILVAGLLFVLLWWAWETLRP